MKAILLKSFGDADQLYLGECPDPQPGPHDLVVGVRATALNRADLLQRQGKYPPPPGESEILGLEVAGVVEGVGERVRRFEVGDRVCGLLAGGGYAEKALLNEYLALPIPAGMSFEQAAAIPEAFLTAFQALVWLADLQEGEAVLIHAGASGVGTAAIQLARGLGARVYVTASEPKHPLCLELGAAQAIDYRNEDFAEEIRRLTKGRGVQVVIDFIGAAYLERNLEALSLDGRLVLLALMGGAKVPEFRLLPLLRKRLKVMGSTLRNRSLEYKTALTHAFKAFAWEGFKDGTFRPVIDSVFPWAQVAEAHRRMEANLNQGKIVLLVGEEGG